MSVDLCLSVLEIEKSAEPNWDAAKKHLDSLSEEECRAIVAQEYGLLDGSKIEEIGIKSAKDRLNKAFQNVQEGWNDGLTLMVVIQGAFSNMLIAADSTCDDEVTEVMDLALFAASCGREAGFIV